MFCFEDLDCAEVEINNVSRAEYDLLLRDLEECNLQFNLNLELKAAIADGDVQLVKIFTRKLRKKN